jgi:N-acylneuraminate cytidylyltransferase
MRSLAGYPLLAYAIASAKHSGLFSNVYVSTEDSAIAYSAWLHGAEVIDRPAALADWQTTEEEVIRHALSVACHSGDFMVVRATTPFRTADTLRRAWSEWMDAKDATSMRGGKKPDEHPEKMWRYKCSGEGYWIEPYTDTWKFDGPSQALEQLFSQCGCLHISSTETIEKYGDYTGPRPIPFSMQMPECLDINTEWDMVLAEAIVERGLAKLEPVP